MMKNEGNEMIRIGTDVIGDFNQFYEWVSARFSDGVQMVHCTHIGPGGGNPYVEVEFPNIKAVRKFALTFFIDGPSEFAEWREMHEVPWK
jgi:hypothetical protein